jgi:hypothetical protein
MTRPGPRPPPQRGNFLSPPRSWSGPLLHGTFRSPIRAVGCPHFFHTGAINRRWLASGHNPQDDHKLGVDGRRTPRYGAAHVRNKSFPSPGPGWHGRGLERQGNPARAGRSTGSVQQTGRHRVGSRQQKLVHPAPLQPGPAHVFEFGFIGTYHHR